MGKFLLGILFAVVAAAAAGYAVLTNGVIPAGASVGPIWGEDWAASTDLHAVLAHDAPKEPNPVALSDANLIAGIQLYGKHCAICHGTAKGNASASPIAKGEWPAPPQFASDGVEDDPEGYTFWKVKNGIRWSGMPAHAGVLTDQQIWTLALFLKHMDKLPPAAAQVWQEVQN
ncbi:MAG TPA: c-type cytochrome [Stellaceae bacterium]|nr:c-type cytochrome [Stellaceae bacterium]